MCATKSEGIQTLIYAIGDIHGQKAMLDHALALIEVDGAVDAHIVFIGDYADRGPAVFPF